MPMVADRKVTLKAAAATAAAAAAAAILPVFWCV
jgi:hypothetical protein